MNACIRGFGGKRGYAGMRIYGYADMRVRRTGLIIQKKSAVNTKNHSCEGVFICGKTFPFSRLIQHQYIENSFINKVTRWVKRSLS